MSAIINIGSVHAASQLTQGASSAASPSRLPEAQLGPDTVELSALGEALSHATELSSLSVARIRAIRASIDNGTFETPERINGTAARLAGRIG